MRISVLLKWVLKVVAVLGLWLLCPTLSQAATINVPGVDNSTIQSAIDNAVNGDTVLVADGTYHERINFSGKAITVRSVNGASVTAINGDAGGSVVTFDHSESNSSVLSGFTIENGFGNLGGGIYCGNSSSPAITDCTIISNRAKSGGGIVCDASSLAAITSCTINGNIASRNGGGISCYSSSPAITNCTISNNIASHYYGGGTYCYSSSPAISNCTINNNIASRNGGGIFCNSSSPAITNCTISSNTSRYGGGVFIYSSSSSTVANCTINGNIASYGGGMYCASSSLTITSCTIGSNMSRSGGGMYCYSSSSPAIRSCSISGNTAGNYGGGIFCYSSSSPAITNCIISGNMANNYYGGGVYCSTSSSPAITNCTISGNTASNYGGGISCDKSSPAVLNSILWGDTAKRNSGDEIYLYDSTITVTYSDIQGGYTGTGNINANPKFVGGGNYHLKGGSPCIDSANSNSPVTSHDKDGNPRYDDPVAPNTGTGDNGHYYDMGAYERQTPSNILPAAPSISSPTHPNQAVWYKGNAATFNWTVPSDESGINGYSYILNQTAATIPDTVSEGTAAAKSYTGLASSTWYFHVRARNGAGNWGPASHYTVNVDNVAPGIPTVSSFTHPSQTVWYDNHNPVFNWTIQADLTGVSGYSYVLDQTRATVPDTVITSTAAKVSYSNITSGKWYFHVRATDGVGNWGNTCIYSIHIGIITPAAPVVSSATHPNQGLNYNNNSPTFNWTAEPDLSGIAGYSYILDQTAATIPDTISEGTATTKSYTGKANGTWYFHIRAKDGAGKWSAAAHYTIHIDTNLP